MHRNIKSSLLFTVLFLFIYVPAYNQQKKPVPVIFDTDMGPDYDDIGAITI